MRGAEVHAGREMESVQCARHRQAVLSMKGRGAQDIWVSWVHVGCGWAPGWAPATSHYPNLVRTSLLAAGCGCQAGSQAEEEARGARAAAAGAKHSPAKGEMLRETEWRIRGGHEN
jgi:hypothetical protein